MVPNLSSGRMERLSPGSCRPCSFMYFQMAFTTCKTQLLHHPSPSLTPSQAGRRPCRGVCSRRHSSKCSSLQRESSAGGRVLYSGHTCGRGMCCTPRKLCISGDRLHAPPAVPEALFGFRSCAGSSPAPCAAFFLAAFRSAAENMALPAFLTLAGFFLGASSSSSSASSSSSSESDSMSSSSSASSCLASVTGQREMDQLSDCMAWTLKFTHAGHLFS